MKVSKKILSYLQEGGSMPAEDPAMAGGAPEAAPAQGGDEALMQAAQQLVEMLMQQIGDPQAVTAVLQAALEMVAGAAQEAQPTYQKLGGRLQRVRK